MSIRIESEAFRRAALRSERYRILGLLGVAGVTTAVVLLRNFFLGSLEELALLPQTMAILVSFAAYEGLMLAVVNRLIRRDTNLPPWAWGFNLFVETLIPTLAILIITDNPIVGPYKALTEPPVAFYFVFIILSTLRLNPALSQLTGAFSAAGYLALLGYTMFHYPIAGYPGALRPPMYVTWAIVMLIGGFAAAAVAGQIRVHVAAALREAETRRQVERLEHDLGIARSIQQGLLPKTPPRVDGFEIAGWNKPADETGGDYFDWQEFPDGRVAITLADVTGHGIGPALVTAVCRAYGRASFSSGDDLGAIMDRINELLVEDLPPGKLITFVVALLEPSRSAVQLLSAGHGPLLLYTRAANRIENFKAHGVPFGVAPGMDYGPAQDIVLAPGDLLVLVTDGFFEWANADDEEFGLQRLQETIVAARDLPAAEIIHRMYDAVSGFVGGTAQQDDLTAVIIRRHPEV